MIETRKRQGRHVGRAFRIILIENVPGEPGLGHASAIHPLIDSVAVARRLLDGYQRQLPELAYLRA
jgi:6-phospho-beta-glucosidase